MDFAASLALIAPEITLSVSGLVLLLAAAWMGDKASQLISWLAVAVLAACAAMVAPALCGGAMGGQSCPCQCRANPDRILHLSGRRAFHFG